MGSTYETPLPGEAVPAWVGSATSSLHRIPAAEPWPSVNGEQPADLMLTGETTGVHAANLARLGRLLHTLPSVHVMGMFEGVRCAAHDRMPWAGAVVDEPAAFAQRLAVRGAGLRDLPRVPGLYVCCALGSRGLTLAPLLAELLAAQIEGEPWPVERALADAVDPGRVLLRHLRTSGAG